MNTQSRKESKSLNPQPASQVWADANHLSCHNPHSSTVLKPTFWTLTPVLLVSSMLIAVLCGLSKFDIENITRNTAAEWNSAATQYSGKRGSIHEVAAILNQELVGENLLSLIRYNSGTVQLEDLKKGVILDSNLGLGMTPVRAAISKNGGLYIVGYNENSLSIHDLENNRLSTFAHDFDIFNLAVAPDNRHVAVSGHDGQIVIYQRDASDNWLLCHYINLEAQSFNFLKFSPDSQFLFSASTDVTGRLWNTATGKLHITTKGHEQSITAADFTADGKQLITTGVDGRILFWNVDNGEFLHQLHYKTCQITSLQCSADGNILLLGSTCGQIMRINRTDDSKQVIEKAHNGAVAHLNYLPSTYHIFSSSFDGETIDWDFSNGTISKSAVLHNLHTFENRN